jgi:hypothetical protein
MSITASNFYEKGVLINVRAGGYRGRKKLPKEKLGELPPEIVRGVHDLFDKEFKTLLSNIRSFDGTSRDVVKNQSVPFPIEGIYFINSSRMVAILDILEGRKESRQALIQEAVDNYEGAITIFAEKYPEFYAMAKSKYPSKEEFEKRFYFDYNLIKISSPNQDDPFMTAEMYRSEMNKFRQTIDEMKNEVLSTIASTLLEATKRLTDQCTEGKPNQRTLDNLNKFLKQVDDVYSDFIDRDDLKSAIANVRASILGVDAESLRGQEDFKKEFKKSISSAADCIKALPDVKLKRSIEF